VTRILVVDDEPAILDAVTYSLEGEGYEVLAVSDGEAALRVAEEEAFDAVVLDVMLPRLSGSEICRRLRGQSSVPIIMLTARSSEVERVLGLEVGADDYVSKPFSMPELLARVRALLRRRELDRSEVPTNEYRVGGLKLDLRRHSATVNGALVALTRSEFKLLTLLAAAPDRVFSRRELIQHLWSSEFVGDERACDSHVVNLRRKLERDPNRPERILTVRGVGYKLVAV